MYSRTSTLMCKSSIAWTPRPGRSTRRLSLFLAYSRGKVRSGQGSGGVLGFTGFLSLLGYSMGLHCLVPLGDPSFIRLQTGVVVFVPSI